MRGQGRNAIGAVGVIHNGKVPGTPPVCSSCISGSVITYTTKRAALLDPRTKSCSNAGCAHAVKAVTRSTPQPFRAWSSTTCTRRMAAPPPPSTLTCGTAATNCSRSWNGRSSDNNDPPRMDYAIPPATHSELADQPLTRVLGNVPRTRDCAPEPDRQTWARSVNKRLVFGDQKFAAGKVEKVAFVFKHRG